MFLSFRKKKKKPGKKCQAKKMPGKNAMWLGKMPSGTAIYWAGRKKPTRVGIAIPIGFFPTRVGFFRPHRLFLPYRQKCQDPGFFHGEKNARALAFLPKEKMPAFWYFFEGCRKSMSEKADTCQKKPTLVGKTRQKPDIAKKNLEFFFKKLYLFFQKIFMFILSLKCIYNKKNIMYF